MNRLLSFLKDWMLPLAIVLGISLYLIYHFTPALYPIGPAMHVLASEGQRFLIAVLLFCQYVKTAPRDLRFHRWHFWALAFQILAFVACAAAALVVPQAGARVLLECGMICLICPTAAASGVITDRLGGDLAGNVTYLLLINVVATFLIPAVVPLVHPSPDYSFWQSVGTIAGRIFPMLVLPCLLAWLIRFGFPRLQEKILPLAGYSFYVWGVSLTIAMALATRALVLSDVPGAVVAGIVLVSVAACLLQFLTGRLLGRDERTRLTASQTLGQKNTGFLIWLGYSFLTPVTSIAGGLYAIWQNIINSWELYRKRHGAQRPE